MNKKRNSILLILICVLFIGIIIVFILKNSYKININLVSETVEVNVYDRVDVKNYITSVTDSQNNNLIDNVKISIEADDLDEIEGTNIFIKSYSDKIVKYTVWNKGNRATKILTLKVLSDPNDENYNPNFNEEMPINDYDTPDNPGDKNFTQEQQDYINSFLN